MLRTQVQKAKTWITITTIARTDISVKLAVTGQMMRGYVSRILFWSRCSACSLVSKLQSPICLDRFHSSSGLVCICREKYILPDKLRPLTLPKPGYLSVISLYTVFIILSTISVYILGVFRPAQQQVLHVSQCRMCNWTHRKMYPAEI